MDTQQQGRGAAILMQPGTQIIIPFVLAYIGGFIYFLIKGYRNADDKRKDNI
jgi:hypothetical protein